VNVNSIVSDVRDRMLARRKMQTEATVWAKLPEHKQREEIQEAHNAAFDIVRSVTELVATRGVELIHAQFKSAAIDDKCNIKIMLAGRTDDEQLVALNRVGSKILKIMVLDHDQFNAERTEVKPDADQPEMFNEDEKPDAPVEGAIADQLREAGYDVQQDEDGNQEIEETHGSNEETQEAMAIEQDQAPDDADPFEAGQAARIDGKGPDDNPFDGGTDDYIAWSEGHAEADGEISQLVQQGYDARKEGKDESKNPWKAKSRENGWWLEGYNKAKNEDLPKDE